MRPINPSVVTQKFANPDSYSSLTDIHGPAGHHTGIDYACVWPIKTEGRLVRTIVPGHVLLSSVNPTMGNWVGVYNAEHDLFVTYWHMQTRLVGTDTGWIEVFTPVGRADSTGNSTGHHVHMQVNRGRAFNYNAHIDPKIASRLYTYRQARARYRQRH